MYGLAVSQLLKRQRAFATQAEASTRAAAIKEQLEAAQRSINLSQAASDLGDEAQAANQEWNIRIQSPNPTQQDHVIESNHCVTASYCTQAYNRLTDT